MTPVQQINHVLASADVPPITQLNLPSTTFVPKGWGYEFWITNTPLYCAKILFVKAGKRMSWHYHNVKDETFYVQSGKVILLYADDDCRPYSWPAGFMHSDPPEGFDVQQMTYRILTPGMMHHIPPGLRHMVVGIDDAHILEVSTEHKEEDSIRLVKGD